MFFSLAGRHDEYKNTDKIWTSLAWRAVPKLLLSAQVKELYWVEGRLAVGYPYSIISPVKKKTLINPWFSLVSYSELTSDFPNFVFSTCN